MFTRKRFNVPDESPVARAVQDWTLGLEQPGALAIRFDDLPTVGVVSVEDYIKKSDVDATAGIRAATAALVAKGGGALWFKPGKNYTIWTAGISTVVALNGANNIRVIGNGCTITSALVNSTPVGSAVFIDVNGVSGCSIDGFKFIGGNTSLTSTAGERFIYGHDGSINVAVTNCTIKNCLSGIYYFQGTTANYGLVWVNVTCDTVYYPLNLYRTSDIFARFTSINAGRSVAFGNPIHNADIRLTSSHGGPFSDAIFGINCDDRNSVEDNTMSNLRLNYHTTGRYSGSGNQNSQESMISFDFNQQTAGHTAAGHFRNIDVNFCCDATADRPNRVVHFRRYDITSGTIVGDASARNHTVRGVRISGSMLNGNQLQDAAIKLFATDTVSAVAMNWSGDTIQNIAVRDVNIQGVPSSDAIYVNGQGATASQPFLTLDNVYCDGPVTYANVTNANIEERNVKNSTFDASSARNVAFTPSWTATTVNPAIGNGAIVGYYSRIGRDIEATVIITPGSTTTFGTGEYSVSLPVAVSGSGNGSQGSCLALNSGTNFRAGITSASAGGTSMSAYFDASGSAWAPTVPWTFKNGDYMKLTLRYRSI